MRRAEIDRDYGLGLLAGVQLARHDMRLPEAAVELEANEQYEHAASIMVIERSAFVLGFTDGYSGWIAGIV